MVPFSGRVLGRAIVAATVILAAASSSASAQSSIGFTGGGSIDPEQVYAGVFWQSPDIGGRFRIRPGVDGGFGDGLRLATVNVDFVYLIPLGQGTWTLVTGGGPAVVLTRLSEDRFDLGTEVSAGASYLIGFAHDNGFFTDIRLGGGHVPGLKFGVGWAIRLQ